MIEDTYGWSIIIVLGGNERHVCEIHGLRMRQEGRLRDSAPGLRRLLTLEDAS